jgi:hypothetical protein
MVVIHCMDKINAQRIINALARVGGCRYLHDALGFEINRTRFKKSTDRERVLRCAAEGWGRMGA